MGPVCLFHVVGLKPDHSSKRDWSMLEDAWHNNWYMQTCNTLSRFSIIC